MSCTAVTAVGDKQVIPMASGSSRGIPNPDTDVHYTHLSFLRSPWEEGLTAILGKVEAVV